MDATEFQFSIILEGPEFRAQLLRRPQDMEDRPFKYNISNGKLFKITKNMTAMVRMRLIPSETEAGI